MKKLTVHPVVRAVFVVATVMVLTTGVTFAVLRAETLLTNNTIDSASASLQISTNNTTYSSSRAGYSFEGLLPGGEPKPVLGHPVWLRNNGTSDLAVKVAVSSVPIVQVSPDGSPVDLSKVMIEFERLDGDVIEHSLQALVEAFATGGVALPDVLVMTDDNTEYRLRARFLADAFSGASLSIDDIDLVFYGEGVEL